MRVRADDGVAKAESPSITVLEVESARTSFTRTRSQSVSSCLV